MNESAPQIQPSDQRPWTVIVREGIVVGRYRAEDSYATDADVSQVALGTSPAEIYEVYEVDARMAPPPEVGERVTPDDVQQWTHARAKNQPGTPQPDAGEEKPDTPDRRDG